MGFETQETNPLNKNTGSVVDPFGSTIEVDDATGVSPAETLDGLGRVAATTGGPSGPSQTVYDDAHNTVKEIDANGAVTIKVFDGSGNLASLTDPVGNETRWLHDADNHATKETDPSGGVKTWQYDTAGRLTVYKDQLGQETDYGYYNDDRLYTETWKNASGTTVNTVTYTYNAAGQMLTAVDNAGTVSRGYDTLGRLTSQTDVWGDTVSYTWDAGNNLTKITDSLGGTTTLVNDAVGNLTDRKFSDTASHALSVKYQYDAADQVTTITRYSDATETTSVGSTNVGHDDAGRVTSINHVGIDAITYTYNISDNTGRVATETSTLGTAKTYTYDLAGQVTGDGTNTYTWDKNGNSTASGVTITTGNRESTDGTWNYTYDAAGNDTQKQKIASPNETWNYFYDNRNRLVKAEHKASSGGSVDKRILEGYDALGDRVSESDRKSVV